MVGIINSEYIGVHDGLIINLGFDKDIRRENEKYMEQGFYIDKDVNCYVKKGYGAFITNISKDYIEEYISEFKKDPRVSDYEIVEGPAFNVNGKAEENIVGLYCSNYKELYDSQQKNSKGYKLTPEKERN